MNFLTLAMTCSLVLEGRGQIYREVREQLQRATAAILKSEGDRWNLDTANSFYDDYNADFGSLLQHAGAADFADWLSIRRAAGHSADILDLYGSGMIDTDMREATSITGMRLRNIPVYDRKGTHGKVLTISGSLYEVGIWKELEQSLKDRKISFFDLISSRPIGGSPISVINYHSDWGRDERHVRAAFQFYLEVIQNAYRHLNPNNGHMFLVLPVGAPLRPSYEQEWRSLLSQAGIHAFFSYGKLLIRRTPKSAVEFPFPDVETQ